MEKIVMRYWLTIPVLLFLTASGASLEHDQDTKKSEGPATLYAVGDIMYRTTSEGAVLVGNLMERLLASDPANRRAILAGDICNDDGQEECYDRLERTSWGPLRPLLYPVPAITITSTHGVAAGCRNPKRQQSVRNRYVSCAEVGERGFVNDIIAGAKEEGPGPVKDSVAGSTKATTRPGSCPSTPQVLSIAEAVGDGEGGRR